MSTTNSDIKLTKLNAINLTAHKNSFNIEKDICILTGYNGMGKSSILEAIFHTTSEKNEIILLQKNNWAIELIINDQLFRNIKVTPKKFIPYEDRLEVSNIVNKCVKASDDLKIEDCFHKIKLGIEQYFNQLENKSFLFYEDSEINKKNKNTPPISIRYTLTKDDSAPKTREFPLPVSSILISDEISLNLNKKDDLDSQEDPKKNSVAKEFGINKRANLYMVLETFRDKFTSVNESKRALFKSVIDSFFSDVDKKIHISSSGVISFELSNREIISWAQLSKGEKQLLILLLTTFSYEEIDLFLIDEPEIALHIEWQMKILKSLKKLAPNAQFIIATHSPAIFLEEDISYQIINMNRE